MPRVQSEAVLWHCFCVLPVILRPPGDAIFCVADAAGGDYLADIDLPSSGSDEYDSEPEEEDEQHAGGAAAGPGASDAEAAQGTHAETADARAAAAPGHGDPGVGPSEQGLASPAPPEEGTEAAAASGVAGLSLQT